MYNVYKVSEAKTQCVIPMTGIAAHCVGGFVKMPRNKCKTLTLQAKPIKLVRTITFCNNLMRYIFHKNTHTPIDICHHIYLHLTYYKEIVYLHYFLHSDLEKKECSS